VRERERERERIECMRERERERRERLLPPGVNFIKVLRTAFAHVDPKSVKRY